MLVLLFTIQEMKAFYLILVIILIGGDSFAQKKCESKYSLEHISLVPSPPEYASLNYWIAHPKKEDMADLVPGRPGQLNEGQKNAEVDVFFIYPTIYSGKQDPEHPWFADVNDEYLNEKIANSTIKNQASVFNAIGKIYSPLYRQMHLKGFYNSIEIKEKALDMAYQDVKEAFEFYLKNWNQGRPIIIASHSQGTVHAAKLLHEFFEEQPLMQQLVAAYIIGMPIRRDEFDFIDPCNEPSDIHCWITWNTFLTGYYPPDFVVDYKNALNVNPLSWKLDEQIISREENKGGVLKNFKIIRPKVCDAQNKDGLLWIHKPRFFGNFLFWWKRYHVADYNLFYMNIRENVKARMKAFQTQIYLNDK